MSPEEKDGPALPPEDAYAPEASVPEPPPSSEDADPVDELKKGLGMLFRAAKHAAEKLPTERIENVVRTGAKEVERVVEQIPKRAIGGAVTAGAKGIGEAARDAAKKIPADKITEAVKTGAKEVGKAIENVADAVERSVTGKSSRPPPPPEDGDKK